MTHTSARFLQTGGAALPVGARLTFLINSMVGGGAERAMANLLGHLKPHLMPYQIELVLLDDLPIMQDLPDNVTVHVLDGRDSLRRSFRELSRHWQTPAHRPDTCVSFLARSNCLNVWLAARFGHRAIISERVQTSSHIAALRMAPLLRVVTRLTYPRADRIIAVSAGVADDLCRNFGADRNKITVVGNPIDAAHLGRMAEASPSIPLPDDFLLGVGRLVSNKNFSQLLDAYAGVAGAPPLVILGQGPEDAALRARAARLGIADRVHFAGYVDNPYPVMRRARALISASRAEGFPNTLIEAMNLGCPVVATDCPSGPAEVLMSQAATHPPWPASAHGLLVPMEDTDAMAAAIATLCDDAARADYAIRARKRAGDFDIGAAVEIYLNLLLQPPVTPRNPNKSGGPP